MASRQGQQTIPKSEEDIQKELLDGATQRAAVNCYKMKLELVRIIYKRSFRFINSNTNCIKNKHRIKKI